MNLTVDDVKRGEIDVPDCLTNFLRHLISGPNVRKRSENKDDRRVNAIAQDIIFAATSGKVRPKKHLKLGLAIRSLTGSKKVVQMLNRLGYCPSYTSVMEMETEVTFQANDEERLTPHGMSLSPNSGTGIAWDNFDRYVETTSGKNTLHDTVGICYQTVPLVSASENQSSTSKTISSTECPPNDGRRNICDDGCVPEKEAVRCGQHKKEAPKICSVG